jgi:protein SCO1/2
MDNRAAIGRGHVVAATLALLLSLILSFAAAAQDQAPAASDDRVRLATPAVPLADFSLTDQDNKPFKFSHLNGQPKLVFFGFTHCQSVCPPTLQKLREVCRSLSKDDSTFRCVMISVDGERDTAAAMKEYLAPFQPGFIGLTGSPAVVKDIAAQFPAVFFKGTPRPQSGYDVEHTSQVYLVDRQGQLRATFYNAAPDAMIETAREVITRRSADAATQDRPSGTLR